MGTTPNILREALRLALAEALFVAPLLLLSSPPAVAALVAVVAGLTCGVVWASGALEQQATPWRDLLLVGLLGATPPAIGLGLLTADPTAAVMIVATWMGAAATRVRWMPRLGQLEDPAAAWARLNASQYGDGHGGRMPDTLSLDPYGMLTGGAPRPSVPQEDPFERAIPLQADLGDE